MEHKRANRGTSQSIKWARNRKKKSSKFAKQEICLSLEKKLPQKPGQECRLRYTYSLRNSEQTLLSLMAVLRFALRALPLPHPEHRKPHNSSLPLPVRSQPVPRLFINEKTEHPQHHHNRVPLSKLPS